MMNDYTVIAEFTKEENIPVSFRQHDIQEEIRAGECGEIMTKEEMRCRYEEQLECGEEILDDDGEAFCDFEAFFDHSTAMGGYFQNMLSAYYIVLLREADGYEFAIENADCSVARWKDIEDCLYDAAAAAERSAKFNAISGEWEKPEITIECYRFCD